MNPRLFTFIGGNTGPWSVIQCKTVTGDPISQPGKLDIINGSIMALPAGARWLLRGVTIHGRYVERGEKVQLESTQESSGRPDATCGALIPIRKNATWWGLTQDERRAIFEDRSRHTATGLKYLPPSPGVCITVVIWRGANRLISSRCLIMPRRIRRPSKTWWRRYGRRRNGNMWIAKLTFAWSANERFGDQATTSSPRLGWWGLGRSAIHGFWCESGSVLVTTVGY